MTDHKKTSDKSHNKDLSDSDHSGAAGNTESRSDESHDAPEQNQGQDKEPGHDQSRIRHQEKLKDMPEEFGGPEGPEPTRYGDWEVNGRCTDF